MPIYDYECLKCGLRFDSFGKFSDVTTHCERVEHDGIDCDGIAKRVPSIPAPAKFNCEMPTAPTKHHKFGKD